MKTLLLLTALIIFSSLGEILSARAMKDTGAVSLRPRALVRTILGMARNRTLLLAIFCLALSFFSFLSLLSYADLSFVLPLTAVSYATNTIGAKFWLKEHVSSARWLGTLLVTFGVAIISLPENTVASLHHLSERGSGWLAAALYPGGETPDASLLLPALRGLLLALALSALVYYCLTLVAAWQWSRDRRRQRALGTTFTPPVSILIPVRGADDDSYENFAAFCRNDYPDFQLIFGVREADDPAVALVRRLQADYPERQIELVISDRTIGANAKVSNLVNMSARVAHEYLIIVDSDIRVGPDYLRRVIAPLQQPRVGMVTCLYRGTRGSTFAALLKNVGISSTFAPEVAAARTLEGISFAFGSTIAMRRAVLEEIGGFAAIADYLADDYLLGNRVAAAGYEIVLSDYVVEHTSGADTFKAMLRHELRWARTRRISRPKGYAGLIVTYGTATSLLFLLLMKFAPLAWIIFGLILFVRLLVAWTIGVRALQDRLLARHLYLTPLRDLLSFAVWLASFIGNEIQWRGSAFRLLPDGRIRPLS